MCVVCCVFVWVCVLCVCLCGCVCVCVGVWAGADLTYSANDGRMPLAVARVNSHEAAAQALEQAGVTE